MPGDDLTKKVHATVFCSLMLTVFYRYLPSTTKKGGAKAAKKPTKKEKEAAQGEEEIDIF